MIRASLILLLLALSPPLRAEPTLVRLAVVAGQNEGGPGRPRLRHAESDAESFARVLVEYGGVAADDLVVLRAARRADLERVLGGFAERAAAAHAAGVRVELVLYYSGHSDEEGLLLAGERLGYAELRQLLERAAVDVRIAVLDSCASGAIVRAKGGARRAAFLSDEAVQVTGHAFLTSSSADESAQESDRLGGSFFTHALVSGLRGAADSSLDGRVTIGEAYQFAYAETLQRTERTQGGAQHPAYDIQLAGTGDVVLTDLRETSAVLVLAKEVAGRVTVRDSAGQLAAELGKPAGRATLLGLAPGTYTVSLERDGLLGVTRVELSGSPVELVLASFVPVAREETIRRGGEATAVRWSSPVRISLVSPIAVGDRGDAVFALDLVAGRGRSIIGLVVSGAVAREERLDGVEIAGAVSSVAGQTRGVQIAGGVTTSGSLLGIQVAGGLTVVAADARGIQVAGGLATIGGHLRGVQVAGGVVRASNVRGIQVAGGIASAARLEGVQVAGGAAQSGDVRGVQIAVVNVGRDVQGAQIGVVNIARDVRGTQIGVVNIARRSIAPLGIVSVVQRGRTRLAGWTTDLDRYNLGAKVGGDYLYTLVAGAYSPCCEDRFSLGLGLGVHIPLGSRVALDLDVGQSWLYLAGSRRFPKSAVYRARAALVVDVFSDVSLVAGAALNLVHSWDFTDLRLGDDMDTTVVNGDDTFRLGPGFFVGVEI